MNRWPCLRDDKNQNFLDLNVKDKGVLMGASFIAVLTKTPVNCRYKILSFKFRQLSDRMFCEWPIKTA